MIVQFRITADVCEVVLACEMEAPPKPGSRIVVVPTNRDKPAPAFRVVDLEYQVYDSGHLNKVVCFLMEEL